MLRKATSKIPSVRSRFQKLVDEKIEKHRLVHKIELLYQHTVEGKLFLQEQVTLYETIKDRMQRAIKYADNKCRKARRGKVQFSPMQKKLMGNIIVIRQFKLRMLLKGKHNRPRSRRIKRLIKKYNYTGKTRFSGLEEIKQEMEKATIQYNLFKPTASETRWLYLEQLAEELDKNDNRGKQHHYKTLYQREVTKEYFKRIWFCEGKTRGGGVDRIQVIGEEGPEIIYDKATIEQEIMKTNEAQLLQAKDTPMWNTEVSELLGEQGDFQKWEQILQGVIQLPEGVNEGLKVWYDYITTIEQHTPLDLTWTTEEYVDSWKKMKEEKTTIPGIQVAHIKCLDSESLAASVISKLALIPLIAGYSPITWRIGIDSMIPKKIADLRPEKLRLILLMDARFNHNNNNSLIIV